MTRTIHTLVLCAVAFLAGCGEETTADDSPAPMPITPEEATPPGLEIQGHRGARGLLPENTVPGFVIAVREGADVLEMDLCISGDGQVIVSHEPWMSHEMCIRPDGSDIAESDAMGLNLFTMTTDEIAAYDCGSKGHPRFPDQRALPIHKPTLAEVVEVIETVPKLIEGRRIRYNLEIKHTAEYEENGLCPDAEAFTRTVIDEVQRLGIADRTCIQSFSADVMEAVHRSAPDMTTAWLTESEGTVEDQLARLSFRPDIYSPNWRLLTAADVGILQDMGIRVIPWTVNEPEDLNAVMALGVDGIITDYPNRLYAMR